MKKLSILMFFIFWKVSGFSQIYLPTNPTGYGSNFNRIKAFEVMHIPESNNEELNTTDSSAQIRVVNGILKVYYDGEWRIVGTETGGLDSCAGVSNFYKQGDSIVLENSCGISYWIKDSSYDGSFSPAAINFFVDTISDYPVNAIDGSIYLISNTPPSTIPSAGANPFYNHENEIATLVGSVWTFQTSSTGQILHVTNPFSSYYKFANPLWEKQKSSPTLGGDSAGVNIDLGTLDSNDVNIISNGKILLKVKRNGKISLPNEFVTENNYATLDSITKELSFAKFDTLYLINDDTTYIESGHIIHIDSSKSVQSVVQSVVAGAGIYVDNTDPQNPIVSATGGAGGSFNFDSAFASKTTDNLSEGITNKYYSNSLARAALSVAKVPLSYNSATGVFDIDTSFVHSLNYYNTIYPRLDAGYSLVQGSNIVIAGTWPNQTISTPNFLSSDSIVIKRDNIGNPSNNADSIGLKLINTTKNDTWQMPPALVFEGSTPSNTKTAFKFQQQQQTFYLYQYAGTWSYTISFNSGNITANNFNGNLSGTTAAFTTLNGQSNSTRLSINQNAGSGGSLDYRSVAIGSGSGAEIVKTGGTSKTLSLVQTYGSASITDTSNNTELFISPYLRNVYATNTHYLIDVGTNSSPNGSGTHTSVLSVDVNGNVTITKPLKFNGGGTPSYSLGAGAGTGATASITGNDADFYITINTGTSPTAGGDIVTITFNTTLANTAKVQYSPYNGLAASQYGNYYPSSRTSSAIVFSNTSSTDGGSALPAPSKTIIIHCTITQ